MEKIKMFMIKSCPYCRAALGWMDELCAENPAYRSVAVELIDENERPELAAKYDYYYVPTYFVNAKKVHEGAATKEKVRAVYEAALHAGTNGGERQKETVSHS